MSESDFSISKEVVDKVINEKKGNAPEKIRQYVDLTKERIAVKNPLLFRSIPLGRLGISGETLSTKPYWLNAAITYDCIATQLEEIGHPLVVINQVDLDNYLSLPQSLKDVYLMRVGTEKAPNLLQYLSIQEAFFANKKVSDIMLATLVFGIEDIFIPMISKIIDRSS